MSGVLLVCLTCLVRVSGDQGDSDYTPQEMQTILQAMVSWADQTCVQFVNCNTTERCKKLPNGYLEIYNGPSCTLHSKSGWHGWSPHRLSLGRDGCVYLVGVMHELGHSLGEEIHQVNIALYP